MYFIVLLSSIDVTIENRLSLASGYQTFPIFCTALEAPDTLSAPLNLSLTLEALELRFDLDQVLDGGGVKNNFFRIKKKKRYKNNSN